MINGFIIYGLAFIVVILLPAHASGISVGIEKFSTGDAGEFSFIDLENPNNAIKNCKRDDVAPKTQRRCLLLPVVNEGKLSSGYGLILSTAFSKKGFYYFDFGLGMSVKDYAFKFSIDDYLGPDVNEDSFATFWGPLDSLDVSLTSIQLLPVLTVGITPEVWPDLFFSIGHSIRSLWGKVAVNGQTHSIENNIRFSKGLVGFYEIELVLFRLWGISFSTFQTEYKGDENDIKGRIFPDTGWGRDFEFNFSSKSVGTRLIFSMSL